MSTTDHSNDDTIGQVPRHIAIIMDGNARWAGLRGLSVSAGHRAGVETIRAVLQRCAHHAIHIVTLFAFSSENWHRPGAEVKVLMGLFTAYLKRELKTLHKDGIKLRFIGNRQRFSKDLIKQMEHAEKLTAANTHMTLVVAFLDSKYLSGDNG